ncbi:GNAT family N-acetyltransferase [Frankia sp. CNm7]|uniref:GNAT family N-acetyltransferase n=1 Tax=Frankia nepalensis TaxID=1836974 RepID=A0A937UM98_9ACTN|nr:GNAT family N-acetyltransferase [Frankia nepalensis]MBL7496813.1 GNAT family N-acetyltransferase [Frankia nepalensis]MBL7513932.1 GNAT family N-acetyltransferase [Frankia nepalensis]MBL7523710.1 GNAT family N-acetyltransferase [Frankia nepalensis]MBL7626627.1 GNAT family N-acetyltransferase [Frankia nepalensis]
MTVSTYPPVRAQARAAGQSGGPGGIPRQRGGQARRPATSPCSRRAIRRALPMVRELTPDDGAILDELFAGLSERSRYLRFHAPLHRLSERFRASLLDVDGQDRLALVAELCTSEGPRPVGMARLSRTGPGTAEIAVEVVDEHHRRGVGRQLLTALGARATELGLTTLAAEILAENVAAQSLVRSVFPSGRTYRADGVLTLTCSLTDFHPRAF